MISSTELEIRPLCEHFQIPADVFLLNFDWKNRNLYFQRLHEARTKWTAKQLERSITALAQSDCRPTEHRSDTDAKLAEQLEIQCRQRRCRGYWLDFIQRLRDPQALASAFLSWPIAHQHSFMTEAQNLLGMLPFSLHTGWVGLAVERLSQSPRSWVEFHETDTGHEADPLHTIRKPLEILLQQGFHSRCKGRACWVYSEMGYPLAMLVDFSEERLREPAREAITTRLRELSVKRLADLMQDAGGEFEPILHRLHEVWPATWTIYYRLSHKGKGVTTKWVYHVPETSHALAPNGHLTSGTQLDALPDPLATRLRKLLLEPPPHAPQPIDWLHSSGSCWTQSLLCKHGAPIRDPLRAELCLTIRSSDGREAAQVLLPGSYDQEPLTDSARLISQAFYRARLHSIELSSGSGTGLDGNIELARHLVYADAVADELKLYVSHLVGTWTGDLSATPEPILILSGQPGCGKSETALWLAQAVVGDRNPLRPCPGEVKDGLYGVTEKHVLELFKQLCKAQGPRCLILDEGEVFVRNAHQPSIADRNVSAAVRQGMDAFLQYCRSHPEHRKLILLTTNYSWEMDGAIISRATSIPFEWGATECLALIRKVRSLPWTEEAESLLVACLEHLNSEARYDGRQTVKLTHRIEVIAGRGRVAGPVKVEAKDVAQALGPRSRPFQLAG